MNLITFLKTYLKNNAIITLCEGYTILFEGKVKELEDYNRYGIQLEDIATRRIKKIEGIGNLQDIIIEIA